MKRKVWTATMEKNIRSGKSAETLTRTVTVETPEKNDAINLLSRTFKGWTLQPTTLKYALVKEEEE